MIINRAPEWDGSATAEPKYDPFGEPSRKGTRKPWPNFCQAFRVLLRGGGSAHQNPGVLLASDQQIVDLALGCGTILPRLSEVEGGRPDPPPGSI